MRWPARTKRLAEAGLSPGRTEMWIRDFWCDPHLAASCEPSAWHYVVLNTLNIQFATKSRCKDSNVHQIRNFAEDLDRQLQAQQLGRVENSDSAVGLIVVAVVSGRMFGKLLSVTRATLKRHNLLSDVTLHRC